MVVEAAVGQEELHPPGPSRCPGTCRATGHITASACRLGVGRMLCHCARGAQLRVSCLSVRDGDLRGCAAKGYPAHGGEGRLGNNKRLAPIPSFSPPPSHLTEPRLAHYLTRYEQRLREGPCLFCLCWCRTWRGGQTYGRNTRPPHPPPPSRPHHAQPALAVPAAAAKINVAEA